jgi:hypothetical protein
MVSVLALATAAPAYAQQYRETPDSVAARQEYDARQREYQEQQSRYQDSQSRYQESTENYREARRDYRGSRREYERRLAEWERARALYDRRYGRGAYARIYARPIWDQNYYSSAPPYAGYYAAPTSASAVPCSNNSAVAGGVLGAIAGAVLGSNVAARNARTEGAVLGGVVGAAIGAGVGNANDKYKCDNRGPYFSYDETVPYREGRNRYSSSYDSNYYSNRRCRLAPAPVDSYARDYRYVRVCPDETGRYRITG